MIIDSQFVITLLSALAAFLSFMAVVMPFVKKSKARERYQETIARQRKTIFEEEKKKTLHTKKADAKESVAAAFKVRKLIGDMTDDLRIKMHQAGRRTPNAPLMFMIMRIILPIVFVVVAMAFISASEKEISSGLQLIILGALAWFGFSLPSIMLKNEIIKRQEEINLSFPDALDMMLVCVQGGISIEAAINRIAIEVATHSRMLAEELGQLGAELGLLNDRRAAFQSFAQRVGSGGAKSFATAMIQAEQYGTGISTAIRVMADELRDARMAEAERKAASLPPKLTVPMIVFFLPALFIVILGPAGIQASMASAN
jgi:tight adherence protein C